MKRNGCFLSRPLNVGVIYLFSADSAPCIFVNIGELDSYYQEAGQNSEFEHLKFLNYINKWSDNIFTESNLLVLKISFFLVVQHFYQPVKYNKNEI